MGPIITLCLIVLAGSFSSTVSCSGIPSISHNDPTSLSFCQYFSDGTYSCYVKNRNATENENASPGKRDSFGLAGTGLPVKGVWKTEDGFFKLPDSDSGNGADPAYVGTCFFGKGYDCRRFSPPCLQPKPSATPASCIVGRRFGGKRWSGTIGGRIRANVRK